MYKNIALLDSGMGGLTVAAELIKLMPEQKIVYYGDTLHLPYGPRPIEEVRSFAHKIINYLITEKKADIVGIACNTASSAVLTENSQKHKIPIYGTVDPATKKAVNFSKNNKIGVIGTEGTIKSMSYQNKLNEFNSDLDIYAKACPRFVEFVERGELAGPEVNEYARKCLQPLKNANIDTLILGCTHFPYLLPVIRNIIGESVLLIDPAEEMAISIKNFVKKDDNRQGGVCRENNCKSNNKNNEFKNTIDFIVSDQDNISDLLWRTDLLGDKLISITETNIFHKEEDNV